MDIIKVREKAKECISNNWQDLFVGYILFSVISGVFTSLYVGIILLGPLAVGYSVYMLNLIRKKDQKVENLFDGFKNCFANSLVAGILSYLFIFLWSLLFVIPGIVKAIAYSMVPFLQAEDSSLKGNDALRKSEELMKGHKWEYFKLMFGFIGWILLSILTFGILYVLYVGPYMQAAKAHFYQELTGKKDTIIDLDYDPNRY